MSHLAQVEHRVQRRRVPRARLRLLLAFAAASLIALESSAQTPSSPHILILNSYHPGFEWSDAEQRGVLGRLRQEYTDDDPFVEYMDAKRHPGAEDRDRLTRFLASKYATERLDLVIALDNPALDLLVSHPSELFPGVPVVFAGISDVDAAVRGAGRPVTGVAELMDVKGTIELMLRLRPRTSEILILDDTTISGASARHETEGLQGVFAGRVTLRYLPPSTFEAARDAIAALPSDALALVHSYSTDATGRTMSLAESTQFLTSAARVMVFGVHETRLGSGIAGGMLLGGDEHGRRAGDIALRVLAGESVASIPVDMTSGSRPMFDDKVLRRFAIRPGSLPQGSIVVNRPYSVFRQYRAVILSASAVFVVLCSLVVLLTLAVVSRRRAEAALRKSEERYRRVSELTSDFAYAMRRLPDGSLHPEWATAAFSQITGFDPSLSADPLGLWRDVVHPADVPIAAAHFKAIGEGGTDVAEYRIVDRAGKEHWIRDSGRPVRDAADNTVVRIIGASKDVTDARIARDQLVYQAGLMQNVSDAIVAADNDGRITSWNRSAEALFGWTEEEVTGRPVVEVLHWGTAAGGMGQPPVPAAPWQGEAVIRRRDGDSIDVFVDLSMVTNAQGDPTGVVAAISDITASKKAREAQQRLEEELRQAQKMEGIGRLAGGVAHDFNNLLTVIQAYSDMAAEMVPAGGLLADTIAEIVKAKDRAAALTHQLLAFSRRQILAPAVLDLNGLVKDLHKMLGRLLDENLTLSADLAPDLRTVIADRSQIEQVILNLVLNARDALDDGGTITISTRNIDLDDAHQGAQAGGPSGRCVLLSVADTGRGMDAETQMRIFEPFFTTKEAGKGTGLGLATAYGIIKQSGGHISVYSEKGQGTVFKVTLPEGVCEGAKESPRGPGLQAARGGQETILLVEDDQSVCIAERRMLESLGYRVRTAANGQEALALARSLRDQVSLVITDVVMPGMSGREFGQQLHAMLPGMRILYVSGYTDDAVLRHGLLTAEINFLSKPFSSRTFGAKIREILDS